MQVQLLKCNNIETGSVEIKEQTLNLKYGKRSINHGLVA